MVRGGEIPVAWNQVSTSTPPALAENELHIWRVDLRDRFPRLESAHQLLSPGERERAQRFVRFRDRSRFTLARAALRSILSRYDPVGPECHVFEIGQWGKPYLRPSCRSTTSFNLSHSCDLAVVAIASGYEVGIDLELVRCVADEASIVDRVFGEPDRILYHATPASSRNALFFQLWTGHEALLKATGRGLLAGEPNVSEHQDGVAEWTIEHFVPAAGYAASVAARGSLGRVWYFDFAWKIDVIA